MEKSSVTKTIILLTTFFICTNFTDGANESKKNGPQFIKLLDGERQFSGEIFDDNNIIPVTEISFTGHSKIGGIRRDSDDSVNVLDLAKLKEIEVLKETYISPRYQDKEYILVKTISKNGAITDDLLVPREVVICAIATETDMETSWYLRKIKKIIIENNLRTIRPKVFNKRLKEDLNQVKNESFFDKIKRKFQKTIKSA